MMVSDRIPFRLPDFNAGVIEAKGVLYLEEEFLVFEVESAVFGEFNKKKKMVKVEPGALEDVELEKHLFVDRLFIRPKEADLLEAIPGEYLSELPLKIWSRHRAKVEALVDNLIFQMT